jgi:hypothetical protein
MRRILVLATAISLSGCAMFEDAISVDDDGGQTRMASGAEAQSLMELSIATGRYGAMLGQVREILRLPEPKVPVADSVSPTTRDLDRELTELADQQVRVTKEFLADTSKACQRKRVPKKLRSLACQGQKEVSAPLLAPANADMKSITARDEDVNRLILGWWDAVCETVPRPRNGDPHACSIE